MPRPPRYITKPSGDPIWVTEPFRVFFPLGLLAAVFGLLLWPMHYFGWWPVYPALQHPRILIFGFGSAFVFGFLGTAWPRFLEAEALRMWEFVILVALWTSGQLAYAKAAIIGGDWFLFAACLWLIVILVRRFFAGSKELPPPGFSLAFLSVFMAALALLGLSSGWANRSPELYHLHRLVSYQGFLMLPLLGVGSYLFPRILGDSGPSAKKVSGQRRAVSVWLSSALILVSFCFEAYGSIPLGNLIRMGALLLWAFGAVPGVVKFRSTSTRAWSLRLGLLLIAIAFLCRVLWPDKVFAFEHILFLCGFTQLMLLVADRVSIGHGDNPEAVPSRSLRWRWIVWLLLLTAATRATADLVPSTRVSHHIYAAVMLVVIFGIWWLENGKRLRKAPKEE